MIYSFILCAEEAEKIVVVEWQSVTLHTHHHFQNGQPEILIKWIREKGEKKRDDQEDNVDVMMSFPGGGTHAGNEDEVIMSSRCSSPTTTTVSCQGSVFC